MEMGLSREGERFSGLEAVKILLEIVIGILDFLDQDAPESLEESLFYDQVIVFGIEFGGKHGNQCFLGHLEVSVQWLIEIVRLNLKCINILL